MTLAADDTLKVVSLYGYIVVFAIVFLDQAMISLPSPPFVVAMGALSANGHFQLWLALPAILTAGCLADALWFQVGRSRRLVRFREYIASKMKNRVTPLASSRGYGTLGGLLGVKFSIMPSFLAPLIAGTTRVSNSRFAAFAAVANLVWTTVFFFSGFIGADVVDQWIGRILRSI